MNVIHAATAEVTINICASLRTLNCSQLIIVLEAVDENPNHHKIALLFSKRGVLYSV